VPIRDKFPSEYFANNPLEGETPHGAYKRLQWGNRAKHAWDIESPEPMAVLGRLAKIVFVHGNRQSFDDWRYYVAVGTSSNMVYLVPMDNRRRPEPFPIDFLRGAEAILRVRQIDYYSEKGGEDGYYYHEHESPYPMLYGNDGHCLLEPARHRGGRSYAVNDEGIIG
jgi:hypothetical protein